MIKIVKQPDPYMRNTYRWVFCFFGLEVPLTSLIFKVLILQAFLASFISVFWILLLK